MLTREENERLCRVGPGTPMGALMRRFWIPALLSSELPAPDSDPVRVRLLGQSFVAFRDTNGRVGFLNEACCHRGMSLWLGRVENCGLTCLYHGWRFAADGTILETPNLPASSPFKQKMRAPAYPVREAGGFVWAYLGPPDKQPPFPAFEFMTVPESHVSVYSVTLDCNWMQILEGTIDSAHAGILHSTYNPFGSSAANADLERTLRTDRAFQSADTAPVLEVENTDFGFHSAALRRPTGQEETHRYIRVHTFIMPFMTMIPPAHRIFQMFIPHGDEQTAYRLVINHGGDPVVAAQFRGIVGIDQPELFQDGRFLGGVHNRFFQDRSRMKESFTGLPSFASEDYAGTLSMGPIIDRTQEHLVPSDVAVIRARRLLLKAAAQVERGENPLGLAPADTTAIMAGEGVLPLGTPWQTLVPGNRAAGEQAPEHDAVIAD